MDLSSKAWNGDLVRQWLENRIVAAGRDQVAAEMRGYEARDDYDKAAAEEWVCRAVKAPAYTADQAAFASRIKQLLGQDDYRATGIYDDRRFERHLRANLRKLARMGKDNAGFENTLHYQ